MRQYIFFMTILFTLLPSHGEAATKVNYFKDSGDYGKCEWIARKLASDKEIQPPVDVNQVVLRENFGEYKSQRSSGSWNKLHTGIDLIVTNDARRKNEVIPVRAIAEGTIVYNALNSNRNKDVSEGFGYTRIIDHGYGCYSLYAHLTDDNNYTIKDKDKNVEVLINKKVKAGEIIGHIIEPINNFGVDEVSTGNARSHINDTARYQLHFSLISSTGKGTPAWKIKAKYFYDADKNKQYGHWVDPTGIFNFAGGKEKPDCHRLHCQADEKEIEDYLFGRLGLEKAIISRSLASLGSENGDRRIVQNKVFLSASVSSIVYGGVYEELIDGMSKPEQKRVKDKLKNELRAFADTDLTKADNGVYLKVKELIASYELGVGENDIKKLSAFISKDIALGANSDEAIYSAAVEYGMKYVLANKATSEYVAKIVNIQKQTTQIIKSAEQVGENISAITGNINSIVGGQIGMVEGVNATITSVNGIANSLESAGIKIGKSERKALKTMNDIGSVVNIGASFFASGSIANPIAVLSATSDIMGLLTGGKSAKPDAWLASKLNEIDTKLEKIDERLKKIDKKLDKVLDNQKLIITKLDDLEKKLNNIEMHMVEESERISKRFDELERQLSEQARIKLGSCYDIDKVISTYFFDNGYGFDALKSPRFLYAETKQFFVEADHLYKNNICEGHGVVRSSGCAESYIPELIVDECVKGFIANFTAQCEITGWLRNARTESEIKDKSHPLDYAYMEFARFVDADLEQWYEIIGTGTLAEAPVINPRIAKYMYAFSIPSTDIEHMNMKGKALLNKKQAYNPSCVYGGDDYNNASYRESLMSPINEEELYQTASAALRVLTTVSNHPMGISPAVIKPRIESLMYAIEMVMIQKALMSGDVYLPMLASKIRDDSAKPGKNDREILFNTLDNSKSETLLSNIGLYLLYSSQDHPYGGYELAYKACMKDKSFCYKLLDLLEIPCKKDKVGYCESYDDYSVKIDKLRDGREVVYLYMSYGDDLVKIPLPEPDMDSVSLKNKRFVYSESMTRFIDLYMALNNFRYYLGMNNKR